MNSKNYTRRHSRFHEVILLSKLFQLLFGYSMILIFSHFLVDGINYPEDINSNNKNTLFFVLILFFLNIMIIDNVVKYPGANSFAYVFPTTTILFSILIFSFLLFRITYSNQLLIISYIVILFWLYINYFYGNRYRISRFGIVPMGDVVEFETYNGALFVTLITPDLQGQRYNGIIADLSSNCLTPEWEKFLANCTLSRIPVFSTKKIKESFTGRVKIDHLSENEFGSLMPSITYEYIKRLIDLTMVILLYPIFFIIILIFSLWIKLDSTGPVFFSQKRMGYRGKVFTMYKLRSMYIDKLGTGFTGDKEDPRITKVGKIIRKFRIDELPQIFNVFMGDMSFIGPRPESYELSKWYEKDVPFFAYRHIVRPGISGWAQVNQGYAAEIDGMKVKLEYDFYYIKNFSFWLDLLIGFKTVRIILTGFGAR